MSKTAKYISFTSVNRSLSDAIAIYEQRVEDAVEVFSKFADQFVLRSCPVCGSEKNQEIDKFHETYCIAQCRQCASTFVNPSPTLPALEYYYNHCACNEMLGKVYRNRVSSKKFIISERTRDIIDIIQEKLLAIKDEESINVLEIGCSSGAFLSELKQGLEEENILNRCHLMGVDIDKNAVNQSVDAELNLVASSVEAFSEQETCQFDLVIHFELIEHLLDPAQFMRSIHKMLKSTGIHYFHTPNALGMDNVALNWNSTRLLAHGIFPPMHINAFTTQNIVHFSLRSGFDVVSVDTPGKLDVDIVKLMTEELGNESVFLDINLFSQQQLIVIQSWLQELGASSHMRVILTK